MARVALFMDYENFYNGLKVKTHLNPYGEPPELDFPLLVEYIQEHFGDLRPQDFVVAANFSHYNAQKGGLNKVATILDLDSFMPADLRGIYQSSGGLKYVMKNYADMRLAYEIGRHVQKKAADIYIIASGDGDFLAVAHALQAAKRRVIFLVPDENSLAKELALQFEWYEAPVIFGEEKPPEPPAAAGADAAAADPIEEVVRTLGDLRRALSVGIPLNLLKALLPPSQAVDWVNKAYGTGELDFWESPNLPGVQCVSLRAARIRPGLVTPINTRPEIARAGEILYILSTQISGLEPSRADWRRAIQKKLNFSARRSKQILQDLFECGLLDRAYPKHLEVTLERVLCFIKRMKN